MAGRYLRRSKGISCESRLRMNDRPIAAPRQGRLRECPDTDQMDRRSFPSGLRLFPGAYPRAGNPAARKAECASAIECLPKWKIEAASTALACPRVTPATR
ncbi:hypothetical protein SAMN05518801_1228 [Novosphingobium sp. CF614]|nr:hypothetical protein SAMN05518801_1228 [Novosphingobium sp. CF614]